MTRAQASRISGISYQTICKDVKEGILSPNITPAELYSYCSYQWDRGRALMYPLDSIQRRIKELFDL